MNDSESLQLSETAERHTSAISTGAGEAAEIRCDFCGQVSDRVRRIALDRDYERLQTPHLVQYACSTCSEAKEKKRLG